MANPVSKVYTLEEMLSLIQRGQPFSGELDSAGCFIKIEQYLPVVCTAIHAGNRLRAELQPLCQLSAAQRRLEEAPFSDQLIASQPITLWSLDSRFEYDLNRARTLSTRYKSAWKRPLNDRQRTISHEKHAQFYRLYEALIAKLESMFGMVIVFDLYTYQPTSTEPSAPVFNIGSAQIDMQRWGNVVKRFTSELGKIQLPHIESDAAVDAVFEGRGYLIAHTNAHFDRTLVLPTEVKKVFLDPDSGTVYPLVLDAMKSGLKQAFSETSAYFQRRHNRRRTTKAKMLSSSIEPAVLAIDKALSKLTRKVETLKYINPTNMTSERKRFDAAPSRYQPDFRYKQLPIHANEFKHKLYQLPIDTISDPDLKQLYSSVVNKLSEKIDLLTSIGQDSFLYNSLRFYGRPDANAISNAQFLLYAKTLPEEKGPQYNAEQAAEVMLQAAKAWGMKCNVTPTASLAARAMVSGQKPPTLYLNSKVTFSHAEVQRLIQHELGVHMATTFNARSQPLRIFSIGLPGATESQEGLAILAEYKAGYMSHDRLQTLATRVLAVDSMLKEQNFYQTFDYLVDELGQDRDSAFVTTTRVYRGGGFTKDHLYLEGFLHTLSQSQKRSIDNLLVGKCSHEYLDLIDELVERGWLLKPKHRYDDKGVEPEPILKYLIDSLRHR
ncbi:flavohemoglobin expression-modulating QEGLA motif protein [Vibrio sp. H11]|uniref:flavohemoglobin expression-modulating QEGLA motif protein n=1 Tax=Vibrio sp. H11 TaxID=2565928 RepID=UPI0010A62236|nr:flavohemoglobin expression-modulating QEGLA motif protein [Vibrio sp. H11]